MESPWQEGCVPPDARSSATLPGTKGMQEHLHYPNRICIAMHGDGWDTEQHAGCGGSSAPWPLTVWASKRLMDLLVNKIGFINKWCFPSDCFCMDLPCMECDVEGFNWIYFEWMFKFPSSRSLMRGRNAWMCMLEVTLPLGMFLFSFPPAAWISPFPNAVPVWVLVCWANCLKNCTNCKLTLALTSGLELLARSGMCWVTWNTNALQTMGSPWETTRHAYSSPFPFFNLMHVDITLIANFAVFFWFCFWQRMFEMDLMLGRARI